MADDNAPVYGSINRIADEAVGVACKMLEAGVQHREPRFGFIKKNEDMYNGYNPPALRGRNNVPFDGIVMGGFIDTLMASLDEEVEIKFNRTIEQGKMAADKMTSLWTNLSGPDKGAWTDKVNDMKFLASLAGRGFLKLYGTNIPRFEIDLSVADHYDIVTEPQGGGYLDRHLFKFQMNIFRTKTDLDLAAGAGYYNKAQVNLLVNRYNDSTWFKDNTDIFGGKSARYAAFGIDIKANNYVGQKLYRLTEGAINYKGKWYYILFSYEAECWVRFEPLESVFEHAKYYPGRGSLLSFATNPHPFVFWSKAPADDIRPIGYTMKKIVNLTLDNLEKRNWDMTAYNPKVFTDPSQLLYRQDGLVRATLKPGENISNGIYKFQTPDTTNITINLAQWIDNFLGQKTGITADAQGSSDAQQVGIMVNNLQQVSKRMTLRNKQYRRLYADLGVMFDYAAFQYMREPIALKLLGNDGINWTEEITRDDVAQDFNISVTSQLEEDEKNNAVTEKRIKTFESIETNPTLLGKLNSDWYMREKLKFMGYNDEAARVALDKVNDGDDQILAEAAEAIQDIIDGEGYVPLNRMATTGFIRKITNFADDKFPLIPVPVLSTQSLAVQKKYKKDMALRDKLVAYAQAHLPIAKQNMERKLVAVISAGPAIGPTGAPGQAPAVPQGPASPMPPQQPLPPQQ